MDGHDWYDAIRLHDGDGDAHTRQTKKRWRGAIRRLLWTARKEMQGRDTRSVREGIGVVCRTADDIGPSIYMLVDPMVWRRHNNCCSSFLGVDPSLFV
jgi:hypothetical protein